MRKQIAAANWKMNLTFTEAEKLIDELLKNQFEPSSHQIVLLAVPFPYLIMANEKIKNRNNIFITAQNCAATNNGAFTGEVSTEMLTSIDIKYVLIGHSERRQYYNETNDVLTEKVNRALEKNIYPVFCCGEPLPVRESESQNEFVEKQLRESLFRLSADQMLQTIIAYEPIWAIGTGKTANSSQAQDMHLHIRRVIENQYGKEVADAVPILYGGSVKGSNAAEIFSMPDVDGGLVGGASLVASEFATIINSLKKS